MVSAMAAGLVALACCWAISGPRSRPPRRLTQLFIVVAVVLVIMAVLSVNVWLGLRMEAAAIDGGDGGSTGFSWPLLHDASIERWAIRSYGLVRSLSGSCWRASPHRLPPFAGLHEG